MSKLDKPTFLRNKGEQTSFSEIEESLSCPGLISDENLRLKTTLKELIQSANNNQQTQEKFYELELYFLESRSYESLLSRILIDLKHKLKLSQVELYLVDPAQEIQQLIEEIYGELKFPNLYYVENIIPIRTLYAGSIRLQLTQDQAILNNLYPDSNHQSKSVALIPLVRGNQVFGSLHLGSRDINRFTPDLATNFLHHLGSIISVCIENSINQERYKHLSLVDILTRAKNRRYFFQILAKEIARAARSDKPLSCLFIDIDHFKTINDTHGHLIGDIALRQVSKSIAPMLRQSDVLARFGGEEFTVLLPDCGLAQAQEIAERIRENVALLSIRDEKKQPFQLTISIGVSFWQASQHELASADAIQNYLIHQADKGVYQAKEDGRNCVRTV